MPFPKTYHDGDDVLLAAARMLCPICKAGIAVDRFPTGYFHSEHINEPSPYGSWPFPCEASNLLKIFEAKE